MLTIDFETYYASGYRLGPGCTTEAYIRDPRFQVIGVCVKKDALPTEWITGTHEEIKQALLAYHLDKDMCVMHNAAFDAAILNWVFDIRPKLIVDTLSMARPIIGIYNKSCSLKALSQFYGIGEKGTEIENTLGKRREDFTAEEMKRFAAYCVQDVELTYQLYHKLAKGFPASELALIDITIRMFTEPSIVLNRELLEKHLEEVVSKKNALLEKVGHQDRDAFMSNDKFAELLRAEGVEPPMKKSPATGKMAYAFSKTDLDFKALLEHSNERVQALVATRLGVKSTIEETRTQAFIDVAKRGALPILLNYCGAPNTQRWSGGDGMNLQNLPRGGALRASMCAPEGHSIVACDSSNIEVRVEGWLAGEENLLKVFREKGDVYCNFGSKVYGKPINKHDNPEERRISKVCVLGLGYGTGAEKLDFTLKNSGVNLGLEECKRIVNVYRKQAYPNIQALWYKCQEALGTSFHGYNAEIGKGIKLVMRGKDQSIVMPNGLVMKYPKMASTVGEYGSPEYTYVKKGYPAKIYGGLLTENLTQCLARIVVAQQMLAIHNELAQRSEEMKDGKIRRVALAVHDEVVVVTPDEDAEWTKQMMVRIMSTPPIWAQGLPIACEADIGKNYGEAK